jgi:curved DNA-binding protein CbpA
MDHDYYAILGIAKTARPEEIKKAYLQLARDNHPDRIRDPAQKAEADRKFQLITEAYNQLRDETARREYDRTLDRKVRTPEEEARLFFKNGELQEQSREYTNALKYYYEAMRLQPEKLEYMLAAGRILSLDKSKQRQAADLYEQAMAKHPASPEPCLELGQLYMRSGMYLRAKRVYETAMKQFPHHPDLKKRLAEAVAAEKKGPPRGR